MAVVSIAIIVTTIVARHDSHLNPYTSPYPHRFDDSLTSPRSCTRRLLFANVIGYDVDEDDDGCDDAIIVFTISAMDASSVV